MHDTHHVAAGLAAIMIVAVVGVSLFRSVAAMSEVPDTNVTIVERTEPAPFVARASQEAAVIAATAEDLALVEEGNVAVPPQTEVAKNVEESDVPSEELITAEAVIPVAVSPRAVTEVASGTVVKGADNFTAALANRIHLATNEARAKAGRSPLAYDVALADNATNYSRVLLHSGSLSHTDPDGCAMTCRFKASGYQAEAWGENLAVWKSSYEPTTDEVVDYFIDAWLTSDGHRDNLLSTSFTHEGIGVSRDGTTIYVTVHFAKP